MKRLYLLLSVALIAVLVLVSCQTTPQTTATTTVTSTSSQQPTSTPTSSATTTPTSTGTSVPTSVNPATTPVYGGTLTVMEYTDIRNFDDVNPWICYCWSVMLTNDSIFQGRWEDGPAGGYGANKMTWLMSGGFEGMPQWQHGGLAPEWEINPDDNSMIFHIRQNVHFQNKPPVNGREMTADDVVFSIKRQWSEPTAFLKNSYPAPQTVTALDKYTVKVTWDTFSNMTNDVMQIGGLVMVWPHEVFDKYGNAQDWRNSNGTGPFMITDYVKGASATLVKNPDYWMTDPVGPGKGNKLPYVDNLKMLIIPDISTQQSAMQTGKIDIGWPFGWETAKTLRLTNPELKMVANIYTGLDIFLRLDHPEFPWTNKAVRQALHMAVDYRSIASDFYGGEAEWYGFPTPANHEYDPMRVPFDQLSPDIQKLFSGDTAAAKQMLVDAGYGNGFDIKLDYQNDQANTDLLSIYQAAWKKIGVNLILQPRDPSVFASIASGKKHENAYFYVNHTALLFNMDSWRNPDSMVWNGCILKYPQADQVWTDIWDNFLDFDKQCQIWKDFVPTILENAWMIPSPGYNQYTIWQPWVMNYNGELNLGNCDRVYAPQFVWLDRAAKKKATGLD